MAELLLGRRVRLYLSKGVQLVVDRNAVRPRGNSLCRWLQWSAPIATELKRLGSRIL